MMFAVSNNAKCSLSIELTIQPCKMPHIPVTLPKPTSNKHKKYQMRNPLHPSNDYVLSTYTCTIKYYTYNTLLNIIYTNKIMRKYQKRKHLAKQTKCKTIWNLPPHSTYPLRLWRNQPHIYVLHRIILNEYAVCIFQITDRTDSRNHHFVRVLRDTHFRCERHPLITRYHCTYAHHI